MAASSSARRSTSSVGSPALSPSASSSFSRLKDWICWTVTSSWWAIQASVRPWRTHPRIWLSCGRSDLRLMAGGETSARHRTPVGCRPHSLAVEMGLTLHELDGEATGYVRQRSTRQGDGGMLVLTRKSNQSIMIGDDIEVSVLSIMGEKVRIGIQAPRDIPVFRKEVYLEIQQENVAAGASRGPRSTTR